ncbi:MAG: S8 family serine peptidase [Chromatiales bacterium]|nr:S8 family serine peptidase [Chromatiales bacterium]
MSGAHRVRLQAAAGPLPDAASWREKNAKNAKAFVDFFRKNGVRVVNMSWGGTVKDVERELELCSIGKTPEERKAIAREYFDLQQEGAEGRLRERAGDPLRRRGRQLATRTPPSTRRIPADIVLPNLLTVGAVDKAGDEAPFTSYGPTVKAHANGYQVESYLPGGERVAFSGTSMASPQVAGPRGEDPGRQSQAQAGRDHRDHPEDGREARPMAAASSTRPRPPLLRRRLARLSAMGLRKLLGRCVLWPVVLAPWRFSWRPGCTATPTASRTDWRPAA